MTCVVVSRENKNNNKKLWNRILECEKKSKGNLEAKEWRKEKIKKIIV